MAEENKLQEMIRTSLESIRAMVDANTVVGTPIQMGDGITLIPVSKISYGFASGGTDLPKSAVSGDLFGGGAGAGIHITPVAFLTVKNGEINLLPVVSKPDSLDRLISLIPDAVDKFSSKVKKDEIAE